MSVATDVDVLIVGLGPVGAVAANLAGAAGLNTLVVERGTEPYRQPRAIVFDAEVMRIFASIGLAEQIAAVTKPLGGSVYLGADRQPIRKFTAHPRAHELAWHPSNLFYQPQLEGILREGIGRFPNVTILSGHNVTEVNQTVAGAIVRIRDADGGERSLGARWLLACDGASSTVRKALDIPLGDIGFEERWLVVDTFIDGPMRWPEDHAIPPEVRDDRFSLMVCDPERPSTLIPGAGRHRRWEYMLLAGETDEEVTGEPWLKRQISRWADPDDVEIIRAAVYRFRALVAERWRAGGIFLLGDAAHQTPPFFGQGMCHGIRDAAQLMWKLLLVDRGRAGPALLDSYQEEREPHVRAIISASVAAGAAVCKLDLAEALARDALFRAEEKARAGKVAMTDVVPSIRAGVVDPQTGGMRLPEFIVPGDDGPWHIDRLLDGRPTILGASAADVADSEAWSAIGGQVCAIPADVDGRLGAWLAEHGARWAIVRPDRYVYATATDPVALDDAVSAFLDALHVQSKAHVR